MKFVISLSGQQYPDGVVLQAIQNAVEHEIIEKGYATDASVRAVDGPWLRARLQELEDSQPQAAKRTLRPLGRLQRIVLEALVTPRHQGTWGPGSVWVWDTEYNTRRVMMTLAERGLVDVTEDGERFTINDAGRQAVSGG